MRHIGGDLMTAKRDMRRQTADLGRKIFLGINTGKFRMKKEKARPQYEVHGNDAYVVLTGAANMNIDDVMHLMKFTKLGKDRSRGQVEKAMENSMCFGIYSLLDHKQIGYARAVTDYATCYYVTDVVTDPEYRGNGAAKQLMETMINCEELRELRGVLITKDAMPLYESVGFGNYAGTFMDRKPEILPAEEGAGEVAFEGSWLPEANI